jgi:phosphoglycolate phosphatase
MSNRLAIFDCDGTIVDGQANICLAMERCFAEAGLPEPPRERSRRVVGLSIVEAMRAMLPDGSDERHAELAEGYKRHFHQMRADGLVSEPLYDGVLELLDSLEEGEWLLGVATGKSDRGLAFCLDHHGLSGRFVTLQTADRHPSKPHPSMIEQAMADAGAGPETTLMIGDTSFDMAMAKAAGVTAIGVAWGYHESRELEAAGADFIAETPADIAGFVKGLQ